MDNLTYHRECSWQAGFTLCHNAGIISTVSDKTGTLLSFSKNRDYINTVSLNIDRNIESAYTGYCYNEDELFLAPYNADKFLAVNIKKGTVRELTDLSGAIDNNLQAKYLKVIKMGDVSCVIGEKIHSILFINMSNGYSMEKEYSYNNSVFWTFNHAINGDKIYLASRNENYLFEIDMSSYSVSEYSVTKDGEDGFNDIYEKDGRIFLIGKKDENYSWDDNTRKLLKTSGNSDEMTSWFSCSINDCVCHIYANKNMLIREDSKGNKTNVLIDIGDVDSINGVLFQGTCVVDDSIIFVSRNGRFFEYEVSNNRLEEIMLNEIDGYDQSFSGVFGKVLMIGTALEGRDGSLLGFIEHVVESV
ncbi:hypothetical protein D6856_09935 [Butyrivibrio sp. XB500-5]|uniref:hypothetical protein n=1 Tax=Butyrivibrio sp. XB500-5 TaxID=2364880 RepID=UPI000EA91DA8|nr:hypothetical protein [Butyrivibrio sp. XB500-5]RKM59528.1 hypothetical protein D6856_09935 [Butyrivibrio sp. XB500-5]